MPADPSPPDDVTALAERRAAARAEKDFAESDRLRDQIAAAGWIVRDAPEGYALTPRPPYDVLRSVADLPDRSAAPDSSRCTVTLLVDGWPDDVRTCVQALLAHTPADLEVVLLENGPTDAGQAVHQLAAGSPRVSEWHVEQPAGWGPGRSALVRAVPAAVHVLMDSSTVLEGDALTPLLSALEDPSVAAAGWRGVRVKDGWREVEDAGPGEVEALLGYLIAVRRTTALQVPLPEKARFYRNADLEWSFLLRDAARRSGTAGRLVALDLPVRQERHRGYHDSDTTMRDRESRKTYARFLSQFRGREDLRLT
jgi:hypothetical protein